MTVSEHDQERLQELESELSNTKAELARVVREQALAAESLRASEELKSRLIACSRDCIKILDLEGRLLFMNEGGMQVLEICDIGPFLNGPWVEFWEGADREAAKAAVQAAKAGGIGRFVGYFETSDFATTQMVGCCGQSHLRRQRKTRAPAGAVTRCYPAQEERDCVV